MYKARNVLPSKLLYRIRQLVPPSLCESAIRSFLSPRTVSFRMNLQRLNFPVDERSVSSRLGVPVRRFPNFAPACFAVDATFKKDVTASIEHRNGTFYVCTASSFLPPLALAPHTGSYVIDATAAPGGKTIHLANMMMPATAAAQGGRLLAIERDPRRANILATTLATAGLKGLVQVVRADAVAELAKIADAATRGGPCVARPTHILVDAPCSGDALVTQDSNFDGGAGSDDDEARLVAIQRKLLRAAVRAVGVGGRVVYSTCTLNPLECEGVISSVVRAGGGSGADSVARVVPFEMTEVGQQLKCCDSESATAGSLVPSLLPGVLRWGREDFDPAVSGCVRIVPTGVYAPFFVGVLERVA